MAGVDYVALTSIQFQRCRLIKLVLDHSMDGLTFVGEFIEVVEIVPPVEEEFLADETEPGCELQIFRQHERDSMGVPGCWSISFNSSGET